MVASMFTYSLAVKVPCNICTGIATLLTGLRFLQVVCPCSAHWQGDGQLYLSWCTACDLRCCQVSAVGQGHGLQFTVTV